MEKENVSRKNTIRLVGYLKENLLEVVKNQQGDSVIKGSLIIATSDMSSHKVQFYVNEYTRSGEHNDDYDALAELLPEKTVSIASYLKSTPTATFQVAAQMSSKIWAMARFDEYTTRSGERENSMILLKGYKAGFKQATDTSPFVPTASFTIDLYINEIKDELDSEENPTGRVKVDGYFPVYDGSAGHIDFIAPVEDNIAAYIKRNYHATDTVTLNGDLISTMEVIKEEVTDAPKYFGRQPEEQKTTIFVRERRIYGGSATPIKDGEPTSITSKELKERLVEREEKIKKNSAASKARADRAAENQAPAKGFSDSTPKNFKASSSSQTEDFDF